MLRGIMERQQVSAGSALIFLIVFSVVVFLLTFKCVSWSKVLSRWPGQCADQYRTKIVPLYFMPWY